jgi:hypothetical protein
MSWTKLRRVQAIAHPAQSLALARSGQRCADRTYNTCTVHRAPAINVSSPVTILSTTSRGQFQQESLARPAGGLAVIDDGCHCFVIWDESTASSFEAPRTKHADCSVILIDFDIDSQWCGQHDAERFISRFTARMGVKTQ